MTTALLPPGYPGDSLVIFVGHTGGLPEEHVRGHLDHLNGVLTGRGEPYPGDFHRIVGHQAATNGALVVLIAGPDPIAAMREAQATDSVGLRLDVLL